MAVIKVSGEQDALDRRLACRFFGPVRMRMVTEMRTVLGCRFLMSAIAGRCCPGELGQHQQGEEKDDATAHGRKYIEAQFGRLNAERERAAAATR